MLAGRSFSFAVCVRASRLRVITADPGLGTFEGLRCYSDVASSTEQPNEPTISKGRMMPFPEYRKLRKSLKWQTRICGIPFALAGMAVSATINVYLNPGMFEMTPEEVTPIL